ncbi:hypothetical protein C2A27_15080 [Listeria monocytogenes]|nr:hypothetical protein [Listeria monocytogenes]EAF5393049.1 hypothetical protein [Listeria monocytogenes]
MAMSGEQTYVDDFFKGMEIPPEVEGLQGDTLGHIEDDVLTETGTLAEKQAEQAFIKEDPSITAKKVKGALQSAFPDLPKKHFSVQVNRLGDIDVKWVDYPAKKTVEEIIKGYQSATYDKELETDIVHGYEENGQRIQGAGYITLSGTLSDLTKERMLQFADRIGLDTSNRQLAKAAIEKVAEGYYLLSHNEATAGLDAKEVLPVIEIPPTQQEVEAMKHEMVGQAKEQEKTREAFDPLKEITIEDTQTSAKQEAGEGEKVSYVIEVEDKPIDFTDTQADLANLKNGYTVKFSNGSKKEMPGFNANLYKDPEEQIRTLLAGKLSNEELAAIDVSKRKESNIVNQVRSKEPKRTEENEIEKISDEERFKEDYKASVLYELQQTTTISNFLQPSHSPKTQLTDEDKESIDKRLKAYEEKMGFNKVYELKMEALNDLKEEPELSESMKKAISRVQKALTEQKESQTQVRTERKTIHQKKINPFSLSR